MIFLRIIGKRQNNLKEQKSLIDPTIVRGTLSQWANLMKMYFRKVEKYFDPCKDDLKHAEHCRARPNLRTSSPVHVLRVQEYGEIFQECWQNILRLAVTYFGRAECHWLWPNSENLALLLPYLWIRLDVFRTYCKLLSKTEFKIWLSCLFMGLVYGWEYWWNIRRPADLQDDVFGMLNALGSKWILNPSIWCTYGFNLTEMHYGRDLQWRITYIVVVTKKPMYQIMCSSLYCMNGSIEGRRIN